MIPGNRQIARLETKARSAPGWNKTDSQNDRRAYGVRTPCKYAQIKHIGPDILLNPGKMLYLAEEFPDVGAAKTTSSCLMIVVFELIEETRRRPEPALHRRLSQNLRYSLRLHS